MILLLLLVVDVGALTLERNESRGGVRPQETECKSDLAVVHYEGV